MPESDVGDDDALFTTEEFDELFAAPDRPLGPRSRRLPRAARLAGYAVVFAMFGGVVLALVDNVRSNPEIREPVEIEAAAWEHAQQSPLGWLVEDIVVVGIDEFNVGAFVTNNPPDGVITIDRRPWTRNGLEELMDHEIGHLLDFALWDPFDEGRRAGMESEVWAECAAVAAGTRRLDPRDPGGEYRCLAGDLAQFEAALSSVTEVCKRWSDRACRPYVRGG